MLEMKIKYNSHNSVLLPFWGKFSKCRYFRGGGGGGRYFRDLIGGQKINVTFGGTATFGILRYLDVNLARGGIFDSVSAYPRIHFKIYLEVSLAKGGIFDCVSTYPLQKILRRFYGEGWYFRLRIRVSTSKYT